MDTLIVNNLSKIIGRKTILSNISFNIEEKKIVGLVGENGSGKSTLLKTILGLYKLNEGTVSINGYDLIKERYKALESVGSLIENPGLYDNFNVLDNIKAFGFLYKNIDYDYVIKLANLLNIDLNNKTKLKHYSLGMKQKVGIMISLLNKPCFLILDEPTNGLDYTSIIRLREILKELKITILISSHNLSELEKLCDKIILIENGKVINIINEVYELERELVKND